ncbi:hypothetical protein [Streptomyces boncukensis]|uniref:Uncharacterized protein n=1 Tax=Streptomyces boncukensis TaxID=2711219 RepID=A0A6G4X706_9ACTN|nr:hypothetical protein [Streptomyces boncukensis]NGO73305.1 hypothetical protein [Streptomyces boncukensis]
MFAHPVRIASAQGAAEPVPGRRGRPAAASQRPTMISISSPVSQYTHGGSGSAGWCRACASRARSIASAAPDRSPSRARAQANRAGSSASPGA